MRWEVGVGDEVNDMKVAFEVRTATLTDDPEDGQKVLQIEVHEVGYIAKVICLEGEEAKPDEAIAILVEDASDIEHFADYPLAPRAQVEPATFAWQAYLKAGETARSCSI